MPYGSNEKMPVKSNEDNESGQTMLLKVSNSRRFHSWVPGQDVEFVPAPPSHNVINLLLGPIFRFAKEASYLVGKTRPNSH